MITKAQWKPLRGSKKSPDQIMLSIKTDPAFSLTVRWRTSTDIKDGYALYRKKGSQDEWKKADAMLHYFETDMDESNYFFADMAGLIPNTEYEYTVGNSE